MHEYWKAHSKLFKATLWGGVGTTAQMAELGILKP